MNPALPLKAFAASAGMCMVAATLPGAPTIALAAAAPATLLVIVSLWLRAASTAAVLAAVAALALGYPTAVLAGLSGIAATAYLLLIFGAGAPAGVVTTSRQTIAAAAGFAFVGLAAVTFPVEFAWLPVVAPIAVVLLFALAIHPYTQSQLQSDDGEHNVGQRG
ncbi:hypothetical protein [Antrihabitans sp. YC2-6]|uniref:hypothetical protein n=1 Tax=Antrihabitans sp. YC2-6 TaxID=2799498 RepID=UPI0018F6179F|nr:hypothetical protein [Antrihabitans sp. YC2-6]MBJ8345904.1 hypothetical protein [Antrihabitans sp. YC2-6]